MVQLRKIWFVSSRIVVHSSGGRTGAEDGEVADRSRIDDPPRSVRCLHAASTPRASRGVAATDIVPRHAVRLSARFLVSVCGPSLIRSALRSSPTGVAHAPTARASAALLLSTDENIARRRRAWLLSPMLLLAFAAACPRQQADAREPGPIKGGRSFGAQRGRTERRDGGRTPSMFPFRPEWGHAFRGMLFARRGARS
jgi:hypothetical protein